MLYLLLEVQKELVKLKDKIFSEYINVSNNVSNVRKFGSAALDMAYVACGRFDGYWQRELKLLGYSCWNNNFKRSWRIL